MDFIWFNLFSTIESIGMFILMLALFRFRIREYISHIVFASFLLSQLSYYMRVDFGLGSYVPVAFVIFTFLFVWLMFRVQLFYAAVMAVIGYITFFLLQGIIIFMGISLKLFTLDEIAPTWLGYVLQLTTFAVAILISLLLLKKRLGFTFVPFSESAYFKLRGENILFLFLVLLGVIVVGVYLYWGLQSFYSFMMVIAMLIFYLSSLMYLAIRREKQDD